MARVSLRSTSQYFVDNVGIYSVDTESVYQIGQSGKTERFASVSREGLTRKLLAKHSCLYYFAGCLVARYPRKLFSLRFAWVFTLSFSHTQPLQLNPTINTGYKKLNKITIKFGTELKPTKQIVVNYNFTIWNPTTISKKKKKL